MYQGYNSNMMGGYQAQPANTGYSSTGTQGGYSSGMMQPNTGFQPAMPQAYNIQQPIFQPQAQQTYTQPQYGQQTYAQPQYAQPQYAQPTYTQPNPQQPTYTQPQYSQPTYAQPQAQPTYAQPQVQPTYAQPQAQPTYAQPQAQPTYAQQYPQNQTINNLSNYLMSNVTNANNSPVMPGQNPLSIQNWNVEQDCERLRTAMKGIGTDEDAIINIVCNRTNAQRLEIKKYYATMYGKDLIKQLKSELSGKFEDVIIGMFYTHSEYDAECLYKAMKGAGTNEDTLIEIIGTRSNAELAQIKIDFERMYKKPLQKWVESETSFSFKKLLVSLLQCNRSTNPYPDQNSCAQDAQKLINAGINKVGTDESMFNRIFALRSPAELLCIAQMYQQQCGKTLVQSIESEFSGDIKKLLRTIVYGIVNPSEFFATQIRESIKGAGTKDKKLIRILIYRDEIDMPQIKQCYYRLYGKDMLSDIRSDTSGDYRKALIQLAGH